MFECDECADCACCEVALPGEFDADLISGNIERSHRSAESIAATLRIAQTVWHGCVSRRALCIRAMRAPTARWKFAFLSGIIRRSAAGRRRTRKSDPLSNRFPFAAAQRHPRGEREDGKGADESGWSHEEWRGSMPLFFGCRTNELPTLFRSPKLLGQLFGL